MEATLALSGPVRHRTVGGLRDRLLASPRFRRYAAAFPLTRLIARRRASALFDLCAGFVYTQILGACVELKLFDILAEGPLPLDEVASRLALPTPAAERLLAAAIALRLVSRRGRRFGLGQLGAAMIGNPGVAAMIEHHALLYADLQDPVALLRGERDTSLRRYWAYGGGDAGAVAEYTALMAVSQPLVADEILQAYPLARHRCLLDVGGGDGTFLTAVAARAADLRLMLFDLPPVAERARAKLQAAGLADRATVIGGDFKTTALPKGADVISLVRVIHDHDDAAALAILRAAHDALPPGGTLLLAEPMSGTIGAERVGDAYFGFYLLAMGSGRPRSDTELKSLLSSAGFPGGRLVPTRMPLLTRVILAKKPSSEM